MPQARLRACQSKPESWQWHQQAATFGNVGAARRAELASHQSACENAAKSRSIGIAAKEIDGVSSATLQRMLP